jgi:hypothetical protein
MIIGTESEYLLCLESSCAVDEKKNLSSAIVDNIKNIMPAVPNQEPGFTQIGLMTANGSRFYQDADCIEIATPEVKTPIDALTYQKGNELVLQQALAKATQKHGSMKNAKIIRASTDYHGHFRGFHINISCQNWEATALVEHLVPFLVTRFYSCAGSFGPLGFVMSQKHNSVVTVISADARTNRAIVNLKQEPLSATSKRMHITHGDACMSDLSNYLSIGATALVVRMLDDGTCIGPAYKLMDPIKALKILDLDFPWTAPLPLVSGLYAGALEIQKHYLAAAAIYVKGHDERWMKEVVWHWQKIIQTLETKGPDGLSQLLDPYIKLRFYSKFLQQTGITLSEFSCWCYPVAVAKSFIGKEPVRDVRALLFEKMPCMDFLFLDDHMRRHNLNWSELPQAITLHNKMLALDIMFHDISSDGIYHRLSETAAIDSQAKLTNPSEVNIAVQQPPTGTRAQARGKAICEVVAENGAVANWTQVCSTNRQTLLLDPHSAEYTWKQLDNKGTAKR